jgi:hypothetical protein
MEYFKMKHCDDKPTHPLLKDELWLEPKEVRQDILQAIVSEVLNVYIDIDVAFSYNVSQAESVSSDKVQCYALKLLTYGLFYLEYSDIIRKGVGVICCLRCWRYLLFIFKHAQRKNYSIEALNLLAQYQFWLTPRQSAQLIWSRCVNTDGIPGRNIPADLHMEHLIRICKLAVANLGSNKSSAGLIHTGKCIGALDKILCNYDKELNISEHLGIHSVARSDKDKSILLQHLIQANVYKHFKERKHSCFPLN